MKFFGKIKNIFLILALLLTAGCFSQNVNSSEPRSDLDNSDYPIESNINPVNYQESLPEILALYWETGNYTGVKEKIIELRVPSEYLDLHFNLVLAFEMLEQGESLEGNQKIQDLLKEYPWIKK